MLHAGFVSPTLSGSCFRRNDTGSGLCGPISCNDDDNCRLTMQDSHYSLEEIIGGYLEVLPVSKSQETTYNEFQISYFEAFMAFIHKYSFY